MLIPYSKNCRLYIFLVEGFAVCESIGPVPRVCESIGNFPGVCDASGSPPSGSNLSTNSRFHS